MPTISRQWDTVLGAYGYRIHAGIVSGIYTHVSENIAADTQPDVAGNTKSGSCTVPSMGTWRVAVAAYDVNGYEGPYSADQAVAAEADAPSPLAASVGGVATMSGALTAGSQLAASVTATATVVGDLTLTEFVPPEEEPPTPPLTGTTYTTLRDAITRTPVALLVLELDRCTRTFGVSPCLAVGEKCYNTRGTCRDVVAYASEPMPLSFTSADAPAVIAGARPTIKAIQKIPTEIETTLTVTGRVSVSLYDEPDADIGMDPYLSERTSVQGTFWKKLLARNPHYKGRPARIYDGFVGMTEADFHAHQTWVGTIDTITLSGGVVKVQIVDLLQDLGTVEIPAPTDLKVVHGIDATVVAITLSSVTGLDTVDGHVRIGDEVIYYTSLDVPTNRIMGCTRGAWGTTSDDHAADDKAQRCRCYWPQNPFDLLQTMLTTDAGIDPAFIDWAAFATAKASPGGEINISALIDEPTALDTLYFEVVDLLDCKSWIGEDLKITIRRTLPNAPGRTYATITDAATIVAGSGSADLNPASRLSRVLLYWDKRTTEDHEKPASYRRLDLAIDADAESTEAYNAIGEKVLYCRWLRPGLTTEEAQADFVKDVTMRRVWNQRDPMPIITHEVELKDADIKTGDYVQLTTDELQAPDGSDMTGIFQVIRRAEVQGGARVSLSLLRTNPRRIAYIAPDSVADTYAAATEADREYAYICEDATTEIDGDHAYYTW